MDADNQKKVVFISGASGSVGHALVKEFHCHGWQIIAGYLTENNLPDVGNMKPTRVDVTDATQVKDVFDNILVNYDRLDCVINAAGIVRDSLIFSMSEADWDEIMNVNLKGVIYCSRQAVRIMSKRNGGHIINFSSVSAKTGRVGQSNYVASKAAVIGFSLSLAREVGPANIKVNVVIPGFIESKMTSNVRCDFKNKIISENVLNRSTTAEEVARFCHFLTTTENISGQVFQLDSRITRCF